MIVVRMIQKHRNRWTKWLPYTYYRQEK